MGSVSTVIVSPLLPHLNRQSSPWNNRTVVLLVGLASLALCFVFLFFRRQGQNKPTLSNSPYAVLFPRCVNTTLKAPFKNFAQGIIRLEAAEITLSHLRKNLIERIFIECSYQGNPFFTQPMTPGTSFEVFVADMPYNEEMRIKIIHNGESKIVTTFTPKKPMGIYDIVDENGAWKVALQDQPVPQRLYSMGIHQRDLDQPLSIAIDGAGKITLLSPTPEPKKYYSIENQGSKIYIIFFEILCHHTDQNFAIPIVVHPACPKNLPEKFLRRCVADAYQTVNKEPHPPDASLTVFNIHVHA